MLFTLLSLALVGTPVHEKVLAKENPSITGTVQDEKGQAVPGAAVFVFFYTDPHLGKVKTYV